MSEGCHSGQQPQGVASALLAVKCAGCKVGMEVSIPVGDQRTFTVRCHSCSALNKVEIDTGGSPLIVAEGPCEWTRIPPAPQPAHAPDPQPAVPSAPAAADVPCPVVVPPKKRQKASIVSPTPSPAAAAPPPPAAIIIKPRAVALAKFHDGYYYTGSIEEMQVCGHARN